MRTLLFTSLLALAPACGGDASTPAGTPDAPAAATASEGARVGALAKRIKAQPDQADAILKEGGFDRDSFETKLFEIAADPALSKDYADALK